MKEEKIKITEFVFSTPCEYVIRTSDQIPPIKLYRLKEAIEDNINRPLYSIGNDCTIEYTMSDGKTFVVLKDDLDRLFKAAYPDFFKLHTTG